MLKTLLLALPLLAFPAFAADTTPAPANPPTLLKPAITTYTCRPAYGVPLHYTWQAAGPLAKNYTIFVDVVDASGNTLAHDVHWYHTDEWKAGEMIDYSRWLCLPEYPPKGKVTLPALSEGTYDLYVGIEVGKVKDKTTGIDTGTNCPILAGPGLTADAQHRVKIGTLILDKNAPLPALGPKTLDLKGYHLTFADEFKDLSVSAWGPADAAGKSGTRWIAHTPYAGDFGDAKFTDPTPDFPFTIKDGILSIEVRKTPDGKWQGGLLSSCDPKGKGFSQRLGYFECRAKLPKGPGTWPAFWLLGVGGIDKKNPDRPPVNIELDVVEQYGHWPNKLCITTHYWHKDGKHEGNGEHLIVPGMTEDFHTYGVMVTEEKVTYYFDGVALKTEPASDASRAPLYLLVNLTLGPGWPLDQTPSSQVMFVDYVRAYAKD